MVELIQVKSGLKDKSRVALFEQHPDHPGGEVFVSGESVFQVARTAAVEERLKQGVLVEAKAEVKAEGVEAGVKAGAKGEG